MVARLLNRNLYAKSQSSAIEYYFIDSVLLLAGVEFVHRIIE